MRYLTLSRPGPLLLSLATAAAVVAVPAAASASTQASPVTGHVYVNDNTAGSEHGRGLPPSRGRRAAPAAGSPFATGGAGTGSGSAPRARCRSALGGRYLLAVDAGSNQISVLRIAPGGIAPLVGSSLLGGVQPVSIAVHGEPRVRRQRRRRRQQLHRLLARPRAAN